MKIIEVPIQNLRHAQWNPNAMDPSMRTHLERSIELFGLSVPLVVRRLNSELYEVIGGNQRLGILLESGQETIQCVVVELDDAEAKLLAQALNHIGGEDDLGLRADLVRDLLETISEAEIISVLPETAESLRALSALGQQDIAAHLRSWQHAQTARLKHLQVQLTEQQLEVVEEALERAVPEASKRQGDSPNRRGTAIYVICEAYLDNLEKSDE